MILSLGMKSPTVIRHGMPCLMTVVGLPKKPSA